MTARFAGSLTALVTPFKDDLSLDMEAFEALIERQIEAGTDGLVICGTTGEAATLSAAEYAEVISASIRFAAGRVPVVAGTGGNNTRTVLETTRSVEEMGADAALVVAPYYNKPTQGGLIAHYETILEGTELPILLYNVPGRTASNIAAETTLKLAEHPRCVAVKEASGDLHQIQVILFNRPEGFLVLSGDDALTLAMMAHGGDGVISVTSNVAPAAMKKLVDSVANGDLETARTVQARLLPLFDAHFLESNPIPVKAALAHLGLCTDKMRLPLVPASASTRARLAEVLTDLREV